MPMKIAVSVASHVSGSEMMPSAQQQIVQQTVTLKDIDPGIDADEERGPERQDHRHHQHRLQPAGAARHAVSHRHADHQKDQRRDGGDCHAPAHRTDT